VERRLDIFGICVKLLLTHDCDSANLAKDSPRVAHGLNDIACASLTLGPDESCTFGNATKCFAKVACATHKWNFEIVFVDVVFIISWSENLGFIDIIDANRLKNLGCPALGGSR
jgi:hypothetical protein